MIPTDAEGTEAETIVDSLMNVGLLTWASRVSGNRSFAELARRHARLVSALLMRPDGSTIQAAVHDRAGGRLLRLGTRQGLSDGSTWARGQAWAIHGLASVGSDLGDRVLVGAAERAAGYWVAAAPRRGLPPYDFAAGRSAPRDSSAGAIAAAGMYELARACARLGGACARGRAHWRDAAGSALASALTAVSAKSPLGRVGEQAGTVGPRGGAWDDRAELIWGLDFLLEAVAARG
jgi:unsaturated chondroitin disaccharide hydrolase